MITDVFEVVKSKYYIFPLYYSHLLIGGPHLHIIAPFSMRVPYPTIISVLLPPNLYFYSLLFILVPHKEHFHMTSSEPPNALPPPKILSLVSGNIHIVLYLQYLNVLES